MLGFLFTLLLQSTKKMFFSYAGHSTLSISSHLRVCTCRTRRVNRVGLWAKHMCAFQFGSVFCKFISRVCVMSLGVKRVCGISITNEGKDENVV